MNVNEHGWSLEFRFSEDDSYLKSFQDAYKTKTKEITQNNTDYNLK